ncbi:MAG: hypothetical protein JWM27_122 [Gemmatimonadetes bacterium]|nr:hypothetical protein [Gemmatimonadota bacterium]
MPTKDIILLSLVFSVVVAPALGITARFAIKPIVDALLRLKEGGVLPGAQTTALAGAEAQAEVRQLREEVARLAGELAEVKEAQDFHRALLEPPAAHAAVGPGTEPAGS